MVGICELCQEDPCVCLERYCNHEYKTYQAEERDTNVPESYTCDNCGKDYYPTLVLNELSRLNRA